MKRTWLLFYVILITWGMSLGQTTGSEYELRITLARSRTLAALQTAHSKSRAHDQITELVFFSRWLVLSPRSEAAAHGLLQNIPATEKLSEELMVLGDPPEGVTPNAPAMLALGNIHDQWPKLVARAVIAVPDLMQNYVAYLPLAVNDMHSDFTGNAQRVCRRLPREFRAAFDGLSQADRNYVRNKVFDADHCKAIFVSEAE